LKRLDIDVLISPAEGIGRVLQLSNYHWLMQVISPMMGVSIQMKVDVAHEGRKSRTKQLKGTNEEEKKRRRRRRRRRRRKGSLTMMRFRSSRCLFYTDM
jgi:hypothetical protein